MLVLLSNIGLRSSDINRLGTILRNILASFNKIIENKRFLWLILSLVSTCSVYLRWAVVVIRDETWINSSIMSRSPWRSCVIKLRFGALSSRSFLRSRSLWRTSRNLRSNFFHFTFSRTLHERSLARSSFILTQRSFLCSTWVSSFGKLVLVVVRCGVASFIGSTLSLSCAVFVVAFYWRIKLCSCSSVWAWSVIVFKFGEMALQCICDLCLMLSFSSSSFCSGMVSVLVCCWSVSIRTLIFQVAVSIRVCTILFVAALNILRCFRSFIWLSKFFEIGNTSFKFFNAFIFSFETGLLLVVLSNHHFKNN